MADWFKFYCDGLDEPRFRYALRTLSEVCPVWLLILSECCRTKSDSIDWSGDEVDLIGWSEKACVTPPKVNEAIKLLAKIRYIEIDKNTITVRKWNDLQSDYCRKLSKPKSDKVQKSPEISEKVCLEERRGEERNIKYPTLNEIKMECSTGMIPEETGEAFWNHFESVGWVTQHGQPIVNWRTKLRSWNSSARAKAFIESPNSNPKNPDMSKWTDAQKSKWVEDNCIS